jgi:membrane protein required for colicin V production
MAALEDLTKVDWLVLGILLISMVGSFIRGFARELISLTAVIVGLVLACWFYHDVGSFLIPYVKTDDVASFCGFLFIFVLTVLVGGILSFWVRNFLRFVDLQWVDRLLGLAFGLLRGCLISSVLFLGLTTFPFQIQTVQKAKFAPYLLLGARVLSLVTPSSIKTKFMDEYQKVKQLWLDEIKNKAVASRFNGSPTEKGRGYCRSDSLFATDLLTIIYFT